MVVKTLHLLMVVDLIFLFLLDFYFIAYQRIFVLFPGLLPRFSVDGYSTAQQSPEGGLPEEAIRKISDPGVSTAASSAPSTSKDGGGDHIYQQPDLNNQ